ncbi:MAG: hypothetical protein V7K48_17920 [Nostoc sp.]|uniref:hypothetical protein n=1 Tax=Nostoc sp. TaxID=1180 RepID=UPI002FF721D8
MKNSLLTTPEVSPTAVVAAADTFPKQTDTAVTTPSIVVAVASTARRKSLIQKSKVKSIMEWAF